MRELTVGALREQIAHLPADTLVVGPSSDHSYRELSVGTAQAEKVGIRQLVEYYDEANATDPNNPVLTVLVIS